MGWELCDILANDDPDFTDHCDLCNTAGLETNFVIEYPRNHALLKVGSQCIKKFVRFKGILSQEDSNQYFNLKCDQLIAIRSLKQCLDGLFEPVIKHYFVSDFRRICASILECYSVDELAQKCHDSVVWAFILAKCEDCYPDGELTPEDKERIKLALFNPKSRLLPVKRMPRIKGMKSSIHSRSKTRAVLSTSKSGDYEDPLKILVKQD